MRTLTGTITNNETGEPLEGVNITLGFLWDGAFGPYPGEGTITDTNGYFEVTYTPSGGDDERIRMSHIGYRPYMVRPGSLQSGMMNDIALVPTTYPVDEVLITTAGPSKFPLLLVLLVIALIGGIIITSD